MPEEHPTSVADHATRGPSRLRDIATLYEEMTPTRRRQFYWLILMMALGAFAEVTTIGSVIPFLSLLADPGALGHYRWLDAGTTLGIGRAATAGLIFSGLAIIAGAIRLRMAWMVQNFSYMLGHEVMIGIEWRLLSQPYTFHIEQNTSTLLAAIEKVEVLIFDAILPSVQALVASFLALFIIAALMWIDPVTALVAAIVSAAIYVTVSAVARRRLASNSAEAGKSFNERLKIAQESLGSIRDVLIDGTQDIYVGLFKRIDLKLALARANTAFIASAPRYIIESAGIVFIVAMALVIVNRNGSLAVALPLLGAIAFGAQRLLPLLQQMYNGWTTVSGYFSVLGQIADLLRLPMQLQLPSEKRTAPLQFKDKISFKDVSFAYRSRRRPALVDVTFDIPAGSTVALVGQTGSGKSTLGDLLMGLLEPQEGNITIDGAPLTESNRRNWQASIAHVPQAIFLADTSIARNIALAVGDSDLDMARVVDSARKAQLDRFVKTLPDGFETVIGERGVRLSGGQRQRLGLARAIYKNTPVLLLDEATSALDEATEQAVFDALDTLREQGHTLILIAHRPSTVDRCDFVITLHDGRIVKSGSNATAGAARAQRTTRRT